MTMADVRMTAWPRPQSSVQITAHPSGGLSFVGVTTTDVTIPGTTTCCWPNS